MAFLVPRRQAARLRSSELPIAEMATMGGAVFTITALAFFRVPILPSMGDDLSMSTTQLGMFTATYALGRLLTDVPAGAMADRLPAISIVSRAAWLMAAGSALLAGAPVALAAYAAIFVLGVGTALTNTTGAAYFSTVAPVSRRGIAVSGFAAAQLGGQAFGPAIAGGLASFGGWRTAEAIAVAVALGLVAAVASRARGGTVTAHERRRSGEGAGPTAQWVLSRPVRIVLFSVPFVMFLTIGSMIQTLAPVIGDEALGLTPAVIGLAAGLGGLCRFIGAIVGGQVADRVARKAALVPGLAIQTVGVVLLAFGSGIPPYLIAIALLSLGSIGTSIAIAVLADLSTPGTLGRNLGRFRFVGDLGLITGPIVTARVYDSVGKTTAVLPVAALTAICAIAVAVVIPETRWGSAVERRS